MPIVRKLQWFGQQVLRRSLLWAGDGLYSRETYTRKVAELHAPLRIVIGAGGTRYAGWISTDVVPGDARLPLPQRLSSDTLPLDLTVAEHWAQAFNKGTITRMLCEHVFEHLSDAQLATTLAHCREYLAPGGRLRIAVPDGRRPDQRYLDGVSPPIDGHLQLFTIESMTRLLEGAGFHVEPLEHYDAQGQFVRHAYDEADGVVLRCYTRDRQKDFAFRDHHYTSIIVDAVRQGT